MSTARVIDNDRPYLTALIFLTFTTGVTDAVCYLGLDRVFTGNMTGNVLFIGFGLVGVPGIPLLNNVVALLSFVIGAIICARVIRGRTHPTRLPTANLALLTVAGITMAGLGTVWLILGTLEPIVLLVLTGLLAISMGIQAVSVRAAGIVDVTTVVVTSTLVNLASDSGLAGGDNQRWPRRVLAILAMGCGGVVGALLIRIATGAIALSVAALLVLVAVALLARARRIEETMA